MPSSWKPHAKCASSTRSGIPSPDPVPNPDPGQETWLRLLAAAESGGRHWLPALRHAGSIDTLFGLHARGLSAAGLGSAEIARLARCREPPPAWRDWLAEPGHGLVVYGSTAYPERLAALHEAPLALWVSGARAELLSEPQLAIVGSRNPTRNGSLVAEDMARALSQSGLTITSGLALGIDAASHRGALDGCGGTIAVLGHGIDRIYPARNDKLAAAIEQSGLVVSEYGPGVPVRAWQFPRRNRIIAGLALGVLVVEATRKSGSLITARLAAEFGREVFAIPGSLHNAQSKGCHKLIQNGAKLVEHTTDILVELSPQLGHALSMPTVCSNDNESESERECDSLPIALGRCLDHAPTTFDSLLECSGLTTGELSSMLLHLELQGKIEALPGGRYCRLAKRS
jgi:DNA processing protein